MIIVTHSDFGNTLLAIFQGREFPLWLLTA
jgi:hypothetical protein